MVEENPHMLTSVAREPQWDLVSGKRLYSQYHQPRDPISVKDVLWLRGACSQGFMSWNWKLGLSTLPQLQEGGVVLWQVTSKGRVRLPQRPRRSRE